MVDCSMKYKEDVSAEERFHYVKQGFDDLDYIFTSTRPVGQQFYQGQHVWNKGMLRESDVLNELNNNSIFTTACGYVEEFINKENDDYLIELVSWFMDICKYCESMHLLAL